MSHLSQTHKNSPSIKFFNLTTTYSIHEEIVFNHRIGTDYIQEVHEINEEMEEVAEETFQVMEVDVDEDEFRTQDLDEIEPRRWAKSESSVTADSSNLETTLNLKDGLSRKLEDQSELEVNDGEIKASVVISADARDESETLISLLTESVSTIILVGLSTMIMVVSAIFYMNKIKPDAKTAHIRAASCSSETSSVQKGYRKKSDNNNNKRESMASSSDFSMGSPSYGSFTTIERTPIKGDEVMLTPVRRSSRLLKNQVISS
ncbi:uncharacterized protein [Rutidosis leptorrhynchoides]|uniref:uncharacterized protein n=1 Tax=Rutidosis leptorrhynchoides TaxID=125765 RepID=UPI003A99D895